MRVLLLSILVLGLSPSPVRAEAQVVTNSLKMDMVLIPAGSFMMGSPKVECKKPDCPKEDPFTEKSESAACMTKARAACALRRPSSDELPQHSVDITRAFYMSRTEVTQKQWFDLMGTNPSYFKSEKLRHRSEDNPVEQVSFDDARKFANKLSEKEGLPTCYDFTSAGGSGGLIYSCKGYRLPTEAEWEYAARAGGKKPRYGSLDDIAWHSDNSRQKTHPVGKKRANAWGLHDLLGNVWEWCHDWYGKYKKDAVTDHAGPETGTHRVFRGGSIANAATIQVALRGRNVPTMRGSNLGFRLVRTMPAKR